jgi:hypothetical protein
VELSSELAVAVAVGGSPSAEPDLN